MLELSLALLLAVAPAAFPQDAPTADALVQQAWSLLPAYTGETRPFLTPEERRATAAGAHLLQAALELEPDHLRGLWSLGHAAFLLAEDARNRGREEAGRGAFDRADAALSHAIDLQPEDPWALYARGAARASFGQHAAALDDLERAVAAAETRLAAGGDDWIARLRFLALGWRAETLMRSGRFAEAREALGAYHDEFSTNAWPGHIALAECALRERDFPAARAAFEAARDTFPSDHQAYASLGYLAGLVGDAARATALLSEAIENELEPGLYTRLWLWILATDTARPAAAADLREFLAHPPSSLGAWDLTLGRFAIGEGSEQAFLAAARAERARRMAAGRSLDDLLCEAWYYVGLRREADPGLAPVAAEAYAASLAFDPVGWKWEWAFARQRFAALATEREPVPTFPLSEDHVERSLWLPAGASRPVEQAERPPRPGDLRLVWYRDEDGTPRFGRFPVRARPRWIPLFNGRDLAGWTPKIRGFEAGENVARTFRVEDGLLRVAYDGYDRFDGRFGHLFHGATWSRYRLRVQYRFLGEQLPDGPGWAWRNSGVMVHGQAPETMGRDQEFPVSIEVQLLGGDGEHPRPTANLCTPGTNVVMEGRLVTRHCIDSTAPTFSGDRWVTVEVEVRGGETIEHFVDGRSVLRYSRPQLDPRDEDAQRLIEGEDLSLTSGTISIQSESHPVEFRRIEILPLAAD